MVEMISKIGTVQRLMLDKVSGKVTYAVVSFNGFLGIGEDYYPMPWPNMKYDTNLGGYRVGITESQLKGAPKVQSKPPIGIGQTARGIEKCTTTITRRCGTNRFTSSASELLARYSLRNTSPFSLRRSQAGSRARSGSGGHGIFRAKMLFALHARRPMGTAKASIFECSASPPSPVRMVCCQSAAE